MASHDAEPPVTPDQAADDVEEDDEGVEPAFAIDLDPEDQGKAGEGAANPD